jgi:hypothetical protein
MCFFSIGRKTVVQPSSVLSSPAAQSSSGTFDLLSSNWMAPHGGIHRHVMEILFFLPSIKPVVSQARTAFMSKP